MIIQKIEAYEIVILVLMLLSSFIPLYKYILYKKQNNTTYAAAFKYASTRGLIFFLIMIPLYLADINIFIIAPIFVLLYLYNYSLTRRTVSAHHYEQKHNQDTIYIFNGDYTFLHFRDHFNGKRKFVFDEALVLGDISGTFMSKEFIDKRIDYLTNINHDEDVHVKYENFINSMHELTKVDTYNNIELYFDEDMFCQINLLALLHYLHVNNYKGKITLHYLHINLEEKTIDEHIIKTIMINQSELAFLSGLYIGVSGNNVKTRYSKTYQEKFSTILKGVNLYSDLKNNPEKMKTIVKETYAKNDNNKKKTIKSLLNENEEYGLPDIYYERILNEIE